MFLTEANQFAHFKALEMKSFQYLRNPARAGKEAAGAGKSGVNSVFPDSKSFPPHPDVRGWFDSSADLKGGLEVQEEDFDSLPAEYRDVFTSR